MPLQGKLVYLREERESDLPFLLKLRNSMESQGWSRSLPPAYTLPMYEQRFRDVEFSYDPDDARFVIAARDGDEPAGSIGYSNHRRRFSAVIGIVLAQAYWGKGFALDAQEVLLQFLFEELGLQVVRLYTHSGIPGAVKLATKSGFKLATRQREAIFKGGKLHDNLSMDLLRAEYFDSHPELIDGWPKVDRSR